MSRIDKYILGAERHTTDWKTKMERLPLRKSHGLRRPSRRAGVLCFKPKLNNKPKLIDCPNVEWLSDDVIVAPLGAGGFPKVPPALGQGLGPQDVLCPWPLREGNMKSNRICFMADSNDESCFQKTNDNCAVGRKSWNKQLCHFGNSI